MNEHGSVQVRLWDGQGILVCIWAKSILRLFHMILVLGGCHFCGGRLLFMPTWLGEWFYYSGSREVVMSHRNHVTLL